MTRDQAIEKIGIAIGTASMCWSTTPTGIFDSDRALELTEQLADDLGYVTDDKGDEGFVSEVQRQCPHDGDIDVNGRCTGCGLKIVDKLTGQKTYD